jgi:hypothetical protein
MVTLWASVQKVPDFDPHMDTGLPNWHSRFIPLLLSKCPPTDAARSEIQALQENNNPQTPAPYYPTLASQERPTRLRAIFPSIQRVSAFFTWSKAVGRVALLWNPQESR